MNNGTNMPELIVCRVDNAVKVMFDRSSTLAVHDSMKTQITARAGRYKETEIVFYDIDDILDTVEALNALVDSSRISVTVPAHLYALENETTINTRFSNDSQYDTYRIELRRKGQTELLTDALELSAGEICREIELYEPLPWGNYDCIATVTALRDGQVFGTLEIALTLHAANLWSTGG